MENQPVEDSFRNAFQDAEMNPSSDIWAHVELGIEKDAGNVLKRRLAIYRWVAAASIIVAISILGINIYTNTFTATPQNSIVLNNKQGIDSQTENSNSGSINDTEVPISKESEDALPVIGRNEISNSNPGSKDIGKVHGNTIAGHENLAMSQPISNEDLPIAKEGVKPPLNKNRPIAALPPLVAQRPYRLYFPKTEPDQIDLLLASIEIEERKQSEKRKEKKETLWTSFAMAAGSYNPTSNASQNFAPASSPLTNVQASSVSNQIDAAGYTFSSGLSVGGKLADRWILLGGVNYLTQNSNFSSNAILVEGANFKLASLNTLQDETFSGAIQSSTPYTVSSSLKYFNVPVQTGYIIIDKAFGWQVQGGISTDFFLQNTLSADDVGLDKVSQSGGDDSPYRMVNFSGLLGTEVSYRFGQHYRLALNPGLRYPLNSIYKDETGVSATPITFDVGLKFHYIFR